MVTLWDESGFSLGPLSRSDLRVTFVTWSPFGRSLGFAWTSDSFRSRPGVFCSSLLLCGRAVVFVGSVSLSDIRFPLAMGSPCGKSQCLLLCGSRCTLPPCVFGREVVAVARFSFLFVSSRCSSHQNLRNAVSSCERYLWVLALFVMM